jgi:hypothetical protein
LHLCRAGVFFRKSIYARRIAAFASRRRKARAEAWACAGNRVCRNGRCGADLRSSATGSRSDADANPDANPDTDAHSDTHSNSDADANTHSHSHSHSNTNTNAGTYSNADAYPNARPNTYAYADTHTDTHARSDACPAEPVADRHQFQHVGERGPAGSGR